MARRDAKRFTWEQSQAAQSSQFERERLFTDVKREAFVHYLKLGTSRQALLFRRSVESGDKQTELGRRISGESDEWWAAYETALAQIALLAPELEEPAREVLLVLADWESYFGFEGMDEGLMIYHNRYLSKTEALTALMRAHLGLQPKPQSNSS